MKKNLRLSKLMALFLTVSMMCNMVVIMDMTLVFAAVEADTSWYDETDSEFTLTTAAQLAGWSALAATGVDFYGKTIKLGADIVFNTGDSSEWGDTPPENIWTPIEIFRGTFDGQGHTISGLYVHKTTQYTAFIRRVENATIKHAAILNSYFDGANTVGSFVADTQYPSTFSDLYSDAIVKATDQESGGVVARIHTNAANSTFERCVFAGTLTSTNQYVGGILGFTHNLAVTLTDCINMGTVIGSSSVGGIVSRIGSNVTLTRCINAGEVSQTGSDGRVGAMTGFMAIGGNSPAPPITLTLVDCYMVSDFTTVAANKHTPVENYIIAGEAQTVSSADIKGYSAMEVLGGFDFVNTWVTVPDSYPMPLGVSRMLGNPAFNTTILGASIRYQDPIGMRFAMQIHKNAVYSEFYEFNQYVYSEDNNIIFGMLIIPSDLLGEDELTVETAEVLNIVGESVFAEDDSFITITGVLYDIPESEYSEPLTARGYIKYDIGNGEYAYLYTDTIERSYVGVAEAALEDQTDPEIRAILINIIAKVRSGDNFEVWIWEIE